MAERTECLCDDKLIGIETIYTVIDGMQINIEGKVESLRKRSRNKELFCPCGCGTNLILVAGEKQLREQHFRIDDENYNSRCEYVAEGKVSVQSKIVLKCWLDDKLVAPEIETRVPIYAVDDTSRKFEFSLLVRSKGLAISYHYNRASLSDEKLEILDNNSKDIRVIYVVDNKNSFDNGQYPERLMKVQKKQGYCLLLEVENRNYHLAKMKAVYYAKNAYEVWKEIKIAEGFLKDFYVNEKGDIIFEDIRLQEKLEQAKSNFADEYAKELIDVERKKEELAQQHKKIEAAQNVIEKETIVKKKQLENDTKEKFRFENASNRFKERIICFERINDVDYSVLDTIILSENGARLFQCKYCGRVGTREFFDSTGGPGELNKGVCKECFKKPEVIEIINKGLTKRKDNVCPRCGGKLVPKTGRFGKFIGCSNYPNCKFTKNI